jgi:hypothetical protein
VHSTLWNPYGVAKFDLSDLLLGQTMLELRSPILNCRLPHDSVALPVESDGLLVIPPGTKQGPGSTGDLDISSK